MALKWRKSKSILGQKLEFLEKFWSFREFLEWFERSGVVWSILNDFIILEFSENFRVFGVVWGVFGED